MKYYWKYYIILLFFVIVYAISAKLFIGDYSSSIVKTLFLISMVGSISVFIYNKKILVDFLKECRPELWEGVSSNKFSLERKVSQTKLVDLINSKSIKNDELLQSNIKEYRGAKLFLMISFITFLVGVVLI